MFYIKYMSLENMVEKYFITSFQSCAAPNKKVLEGMKTMMEHYQIPDENIMYIQLPGMTILEEDMHPYFVDKNVINRDVAINRKLKVMNYAVKPQQIRPFTGLDAFTKKHGSFIFGSPKQYFETVATKQGKLPKMMYSTGVVTKPRYNMKHRVGRIANEDHTYGGVLVEKISERSYLARPITFNNHGKGYDRNIQFNANGEVKTIRPEGVILGDWHGGPEVGDTDPVSRKASFQLIKDTQPHNLIFHDLFDANSISHHTDGKILDRAIHHHQRKDALSLEAELKGTAMELKEIVRISPKDANIYIVKSNHDEALYKYLNEGRFIKEPHNVLVASKLLPKVIEGADVLETALKMYYPNMPKRIKFLSKEDSLMIGKYECGEHGHYGSNGARGSVRQYEKAQAYQITGHKHSPLKIRNQMVTGHNLNYLTSYNGGGLSSWLQGNNIVQEKEFAQFLPIINGNYTKIK